MSVVMNERHERASPTQEHVCRLIPIDWRERRAEPIDLTLPAVVGRGSHADVSVDDPWVSRVHCELREIDDRLIVRDLDSRHGVFVNDQRVEQVELISGDVLQIGVSTFVIDRCGLFE